MAGYLESYYGRNGTEGCSGNWGSIPRGTGQASGMTDVEFTPSFPSRIDTSNTVSGHPFVIANSVNLSMKPMYRIMDLLATNTGASRYQPARQHRTSKIRRNTCSLCFFFSLRSVERRKKQDCHFELFRHFAGTRMPISIYIF